MSQVEVLLAWTLCPCGQGKVIPSSGTVGSCLSRSRTPKRFWWKEMDSKGLGFLGPGNRVCTSQGSRDCGSQGAVEAEGTCSALQACHLISLSPSFLTCEIGMVLALMRECEATSHRSIASNGL